MMHCVKLTGKELGGSLGPFLVYIFHILQIDIAIIHISFTALITLLFILVSYNGITDCLLKGYNVLTFELNND